MQVSHRMLMPMGCGDCGSCKNLVDRIVNIEHVFAENHMRFFILFEMKEQMITSCYFARFSSSSSWQ